MVVYHIPHREENPIFLRHMDKSPEKGRAAIMKKLLRPLTAALLAALLLTAGCAGAAILPAGGTNPLFETWTGIEAVRAVVLTLCSIEPVERVQLRLLGGAGLQYCAIDAPLAPEPSWLQ